jgi:hypothetical protein
MPAQQVPSVVKLGTSKTAAWSGPFYFHYDMNETSQEQVVFMRNKQFTNFSMATHKDAFLYFFIAFFVYHYFCTVHCMPGC